MGVGFGLLWTPVLEEGGVRRPALCNKNLAGALGRFVLGFFFDRQEYPESWSKWDLERKKKMPRNRSIP